MSSVLSKAQASSEEMVRLLRELVEIESPSHDAAGVRAVGERVRRELEASGLEVELVAVEDAGPLLRARSSSAAIAKPVMLLGHLDTVWPLGTLAARPFRVEGDTLFGPGCYDMKAGLVIVVFALRHLAGSGALPPVSVLFTPTEEVDCAAYREPMEAQMRRSRAVLCFEPAWPGGSVKTGRKGSGSFLLRARGRSAHAGADLSKGANAIVELSRKVLEIDALNDPGRGVSVNVGRFSGGIASNVVPDRAEVELDMRYVRAEDGLRTEQAILGLESQDPGVQLEAGGGRHYPPLERGPLVLALYEKAKSIAAEMGMALGEAQTGGSSEASFAAALGTPTLDGLGADGDGAHADDERVRIASLAERAALAARLIESLTR